MKYTQGKYLLLEKKTLAKQIFDFTILCPEIAAAAEIGQFVNILPEGHTLRRPISLCGIDKEKGTIRIDRNRKSVYINDSESVLAPKEYDILLFLMALVNLLCI